MNSQNGKEKAEGAYLMTELSFKCAIREVNERGLVIATWPGSVMLVTVGRTVPNRSGLFSPRLMRKLTTAIDASGVVHVNCVLIHCVKWARK